MIEVIPNKINYENVSEFASLDHKKEMQCEFNFNKRLSLSNNFPQNDLQDIDSSPYQKPMDDFVPTYNQN